MAQPVGSSVSSMWVAVSCGDRQEGGVGLQGISLGTGPALGLAALRDRPQIQSLLVDGAFDPELQMDSLAAAVGSLCPTAADSARTEFKWLFDTRANLVNVRVPVMFIMSELDGITPASGAQAMEKLLPTFPENSWLFQGVGHVQPLFKMTENYLARRHILALSGRGGRPRCCQYRSLYLDSFDDTVISNNPSRFGSSEQT